MTIRFREPVKVRDPADDDEIILRATATATAMLAGIVDNDDGEPGVKRKARRINWGVGEAKHRLEQAVEEWDSSTGRSIDPTTGKRLSLGEFASLVDIPYHTFRKYVGSKNRRTIGTSTGRKPLLDRDEQEWMAQKLADRGEGWLPQEAVELVLERHPELTKEQALRHIQRTLIKNNSNHNNHRRSEQQQPPQGQLQRGYNNLRTTRSNGEDSEEEEDEEDYASDIMEGDGDGARAANVDDNDLDDDDDEDCQEEASERARALAAIDARIAKLRSELLDAELEKERLLRRR